MTSLARLVAVAFMVSLLAASPSFAGTLEADTPAVMVELCPSGSQRCQGEFTVPVGQPVDLDVVVDLGGGNPGPASLVAWEMHLSFSGNGAVEPVVADATGRPVREQGNPSLALEGLARLDTSTGEPAGEYFTIQNRYTPETARLDYSVTLLGFSRSGTGSAAGLSGQGRLVLGRISLVGVSPGEVRVAGAAGEQTPFRMAVLEPGSRAASLADVEYASSLATIQVEPPLAATPTPAPVPPGFAVAPPPTLGEFRGLVSFHSPHGPATGDPRLHDLTVSFWEEGAVPAWQGGAATPVRSFSGVGADRSGLFRLGAVPAGAYDVRVKAPGTLPSLVRGVRVRALSGDAVGRPVVVEFGGLEAGDVNGNGVIDSGDAVLLVPSLGTVAGERGYSKEADFNRDGVVDVQDFSLLAGNFNLQGE